MSQNMIKPTLLQWDIGWRGAAEILVHWKAVVPSDKGAQTGKLSSITIVSSMLTGKTSADPSSFLQFV